MGINAKIRTVTDALCSVNRYSQALDVQIFTLASALEVLDLGVAALEKLGKDIFVETPQGIKAHPVFGVIKDAQASVTRQMKSLGLTAEELGAHIDDDPLVEMTQRVINAGAKSTRKTVKPIKG